MHADQQPARGEEDSRPGMKWASTSDPLSSFLLGQISRVRPPIRLGFIAAVVKECPAYAGAVQGLFP